MQTRILPFLCCLFVLSFLGINNVYAQDPTLSFAKGIGNEFVAGGNLFTTNVIILNNIISEYAKVFKLMGFNKKRQG